MKTLGYVDRGPKGGLMISETKVSRWVNKAVVTRDEAEHEIIQAASTERQRIKNMIRRACHLSDIITTEQMRLLLAAIESESDIRSAAK